MAHHPDWTFVFWTDRKRPAPCKGMEVRLFEDFNFEFLKEKYGEWIVYEPEVNKNTIFLWGLPLILFIFGGLLIIKKVTIK